MMSEHAVYCCTDPKCNRVVLKDTDIGFECPNGHSFPYAAGTQVPVFACQPEAVNEYTIHDAAEVHDNSLRWVFSTFDTNEDALRESLVSRLGLKRGDRLLVTGAGAGNDLPYMAKMMNGAGEIFAQDIAQQMLLAGVKRHAATIEELGVDVCFSVSDATNLPFQDDYFDVAYHFGGINLFPDIKKGVNEMDRVVKHGGKVVISDEGLAPWLMDSEIGKMLIQNNALYACAIPLSLLPENARDMKLTWELNNCFYVIEFNVSNEPLNINIDVPHVGKRGGSIRTRYYGQLEGIDPELKDQIYAEAERSERSRVEYIEALLRSGLSEK